MCIRVAHLLLLGSCLIAFAASAQSASMQVEEPDSNYVTDSDLPPVELASPDEDDTVPEDVLDESYSQPLNVDAGLLDVQAGATGPPVNGSLSPNNKTLLAGIKIDITSSYSDPDGSGDIANCYLLLNTTLSEAKGVSLRYDARTNLVYLRNDGGTGWIGGREAGSPWTFQNSYASVYCSGAKITTSGNTLTIRWRIVLRPVTAGSNYTAWLKCVDTSGLQAGWQIKGSLPVDATPASLEPKNVSLTPTSGDIPADVKVTFSSVFSDPDGVPNLAGVHLLLSPDGYLPNSAYFKYDFNVNKMYLKNNDDTMWWGGYPAGASNTIENSFCKLHCSDTTLVVSGNSITINWVFTIKPAKVGTSVRLYLLCWDDGGLYDDLKRMGTMKIVSGSTSTNHTPVNVSLYPGSGKIPCDSKSIFTSVYSDHEGSSDIANVYFLLNDTLSEAYAAAFRYDATTNRLYVKNDSGTSWLGGYAPGSSNMIENRFCRLFCGDTTVDGSGNSLTVNWAMTLKPIVEGATCMAWIRATDHAGAQSSYDKMGNFSIGGSVSPSQNQPPRNIALFPPNGSPYAGSKFTITGIYSDSNGYDDLENVYLLLNDEYSEMNAAYFRYDSNTNRLFVRDNANSSWLGGFSPGDTSVIENSFVVLYCGDTTVSGSGESLRVDWTIMLKPITAGTMCSAWMRCADDAGAYAGWEKKADYMILR